MTTQKQNLFTPKANDDFNNFAHGLVPICYIEPQIEKNIDLINNTMRNPMSPNIDLKTIKILKDTYPTKAERTHIYLSANSEIFVYLNLQKLQLVSFENPLLSDFDIKAIHEMKNHIDRIQRPLTEPYNKAQFMNRLYQFPKRHIPTLFDMINWNTSYIKTHPNMAANQRELLLSGRKLMEYNFADFEIETNFETILKNTRSNSHDIKALVHQVSALHNKNIKIYRGQTNKSASLKNALSWTLDKKIAQKFATRFSRLSGPANNPLVYQATVSLNNILAFYPNDPEQEVIVDHTSLNDIKII